MYLDYYGLKTSPFNITSNPDLFFEGLPHKEALAALTYGIQEKKGIILITGEVGTGKTTLCKALLNKLPQTVKTSLILNPYFSQVQLLSAIVEDFGLPLQKKNKLEIIKVLNAFLIELNLKGSTAVVIIDEAQNLTARQLEQIRLLSNLETSSEKLLQIILSGQPELTVKLKKDNLRQLRQRIFVKYNLSPLTRDEVKQYVNFRLHKSGQQGIVVKPESYNLIYEFSSGIPRMVNMLFDRALLYGFTKETKIFDKEVFETCIKELA